MDWKSFNLHLENLIPGLIILGELRLAVPTELFSFLEQGGFGVALAIAVSYALGVLSAVLSRLLIDWISEVGPRSWVFRVLSHRNAEALEDAMQGDGVFENDLIREKKRRVRAPHAALWNSLYRGALRKVASSGGDKAIEELRRRREQARLVRNLALPTVGASLMVSSGAWVWLSPILAFGLLVFLYAYAELNIFAEASDILMGATRAEQSST